MMNSGFQVLDEAASTLALEQALAFADACDVGSDDERTVTGDQELEALLDDVQTSDFFAPDTSLDLMMQMPDALKPLQTAHQPLGEFTGLMIGTDASATESDTSLESALAVLTTHCDVSTSDSSSDDAKSGNKGAPSIGYRAKMPKKMKRARAASPTRTAKDFAAANAAIAAAAAGADGQQTDVKKPTKKRIRRQREELLYLRVKVQEMESSLAELKSKESLANRQYKDRERAEQENRKLKSTLEGQIKLAKCLEKILEDQPEDETMTGPSHPAPSKLLALGVSSDQKAVHAQLLSELDAAFDEVDVKYNMKKFVEIENEKHDVRVASSLDNGIALQFMGFKRVPFPQQVASRGMWRFTSYEATERQAYFYEEHETSSKNTVARTFGHKIQSENGSLDYRCESFLECRKCGDRVVIVTRGLAKPIKFSAAPVNGIRFHENGWIVIEKASAKDGTAKGKWSTIASSMELKPIFDDDASDQDFTVGALTDFVIDSFHRNMHLGEEVVAAIMMDEARKAATQPAGSWP
ncbi:uncharacterized protein PITG_16257 [Phytophthora infestans T30-4]|uniref:M96 mating-specific protein family n=1 Tax=Phytophthora infestans (strain T30-4) TaxID=403677 RepID=D0NTG8_PHYIT|nr:uncharacterized protein PITG_16257 [Phytophthora infestans T30-4]EEY64919.1 conserved hypothetical protein [Phytophthora infestans T30-4]|eukprot:XP_002897649.1 conserved hypothetical protein [Phytophthora infestans T30-4]